MTLDALKALAKAKGIKITRKGYKLDGKFYQIEDWVAVLRMAEGYDPLTNQIAHWLKSAR